MSSCFQHGGVPLYLRFFGLGSFFCVGLIPLSDDPPPPALHPRMAEVFHQKTVQLAVGLENEGEHDSARQALRGFLDKIVIPPGDGLLQVVGNLGEMLKAAGCRNGSAAVGYVGCGGGFEPPDLWVMSQET